jgi:transcriptional regulator with XRE-family HTH domain
MGDDCNHSYHAVVNHTHGFLRNDGYMETKASRIRNLRTAAELTQQQVADHVGVSRAAVAKWELGNTKDLKPAHLFKLADLFQVDERQIVLGGPTKAGEGTAKVKALPKRIDERIKEAVRLMEATDDRGRDIALAGLKGALSGYVPKAKQNRSS